MAKPDNLALLQKLSEGDESVLEELMLSNMGLVRSCATRFVGRGVEYEDLVQIGSIGLLRAARAFRLDLGCMFSTYAVPLIIGEIKRFLRDDGMVKVSRRLKSTGLQVMKASELFAKEHGREPTLAEIAELTERLAAAEAALAEDKEKYLRMLAEYDNFRRRTAKEKDGIYADAMADTVKAILPVIDNLERAAAGVPEGEAESAFAKGVAMTLKSAVDTLAKLGVTEIEAKGKEFDPETMNAVMHIDDENLGENEVAQVFQAGFAMGDKIIRHAIVQVAN